MDKPSTAELKKLLLQCQSEDFPDAYLYLKYLDLYLYFFGRPAGTISRKDAEAVMRKYPPEIVEQVRQAVKRTARTLADPVENTYHAKVLDRNLARKIITVDRSIDVRSAEVIIPYSTANDIVLHHPKSIAVMACACREMQENPCLPLDVCLWIGEPFVSFMVEHHPEKARRIDEEEALYIIDVAARNGLVHHAFFKKELGNRFYSICNCCSCCCLAMQAWHKGFRAQLKPSGFVAHVDEQLCIGCGECEQLCPFGAVKLDQETEKATVCFDVCMGCGACTVNCETGALKLKREPSKGVPMDVEKL